MEETVRSDMAAAAQSRLLRLNTEQEARLNEIVTRAPQISQALSTLTAERLRPVACVYPPVNWLTAGCTSRSPPLSLADQPKHSALYYHYCRLITREQAQPLPCLLNTGARARARDREAHRSSPFAPFSRRARGRTSRLKARARLE